MYNSLFRELLTYMMEDPRNIGLCTHLLFGAKNIERIGDHTTNIAENVYYLVTGETLTDDRPEGRRHQLDADPARTERRMSADHGRCRQRILVVEDEAALASCCATISRPRASASRHRHDGEEAEMQVAEERPTSSCSTGCCRGSPASSCAAGCAQARDAQHADPDAHRPRRGRRPRPRAATGADDYVVKPFSRARADGARQGAAAPRRARAASPTCCAPATSTSTARRTA